MKEDFGTNAPRDDIYSKAVRAGKRTYFFDVKSTRSNELYLTITESKRRFNQQTGKFFYEKHKLFLYQEDFEKFKDALQDSFSAIEKLQGEVLKDSPPSEKDTASSEESAEVSDKETENKPEDISFEDLGDEKKEDEEDSQSSEDEAEDKS